MMLLATVAALQLAAAAALPIVEVDLGKLKGDLAQLAWSPDGDDFYVQTAERDRGGKVKALHHYLLSRTSGAARNVEAEPEWAAKYWAWKSAQASPASRAFSIVVDGPRRETRRATAAPTGGALAKGGTTTPDAGTTLGDVASAADQSQVVVIYTLKLGNEVLGEWVNEPVIPGLNFGWAPAPLQFLAFTRRDGGPIVILDQAGRKHTLDGAKAAFLPAWSADGKEIAWLERKDRKKFVLSVTSVSIP